MGDTVKTKYKHIHFEKEGKLWQCWSNNNEVMLGRCEYYKLWNQWVFTPNRHWDCVFSVSCLRDIIHFIGQL